MNWVCIYENMKNTNEPESALIYSYMVGSVQAERWDIKALPLPTYEQIVIHGNVYI